MRYLEITVRCTRVAVEAVAGLLTDLTGGVAIDDPLDVIQAQAAGQWDTTDLVAGDPTWVEVKAYLAEVGHLEEQRQRLDVELDQVRGLDLGAIEGPVLQWVNDEDWANAWKQYFKPIRMGRRLVIVPSWEQADLQPEDLAITLDPGMAFGTGQHATTALCLRWLEDLVRPGAVLVDVGTGSGILAIAAAQLGAAAVLACDIDPVAVRVAAENTAANGVADRIQVVHAALDQPPAQSWLGTHRPGLVVGNLTAGVVQQVAPDIAAALASGARFLASGIIVQRQAEVTAALAALGLQVEEVREEECWVAMLFRRT